MMRIYTYIILSFYFKGNTYEFDSNLAKMRKPSVIGDFLFALLMPQSPAGAMIREEPAAGRLSA